MSEIVVIPAYNEEKTIKNVVQRVKNYHQGEIIVIDDGSRDHTLQYAVESGATGLRHKINLGKGAALKTGCDYALKRGAQKIIVLDADEQHDPKEIPKIKELLNQYELILSYRKREGQMPLVLRFGNWFINANLYVFHRISVKDSQSGYRGFHRHAYQKMRWNAGDYFMETEMIINAAKQDLSYTQIPIDTIYSNRYKGTTVLDGIRIVAKIIGGIITL